MKLFKVYISLLIKYNKIFNKNVELNLTRLHYPSSDSNILVNLMGILINKVKLPKILNRIYRGSIFKSLIKLNKIIKVTYIKGI